MSDQCAKNTDRELYREDTGDPAGSYYENSVHVTDRGDIAMNVGGLVIAKPIHEWHSLAKRGPVDGVRRTRYRFLGRWAGRYWWESVCPMPRDSRHEQISCPVDWFWRAAA